MIIPQMWKPKKGIPTWIALCALSFIIAFSVYLAPETRFSFLEASPEVTPDRIEITNITGDSFTVSWATSVATTGLIRYGDNNQIQLVARDVRDTLTKDPDKYKMHWVNVSGLNPGQSYSFVLQSSDKTFDNNGSPYSVFTAVSNPEAVEEENQTSLYGTIITPDNQPAEGAIVYLNSSDLSPQSALVNANGEWQINLSNAMSQGLQTKFTYKPDQNFQFFVLGGDSTSSTVSFSISQAQPLTVIILGQDYDFRSLNPGTFSVAPTTSPESRFDLAPPLGAVVPPKTEGIIVWNPEPNEAIATTTPLFLGSAPAEVTLNILLESENPIADSVTADDRGYWQWSPPESLSPGEHTLTVSYTDSQNIIHKLTRSFIVLAAEDNSPAIEASPSASLTPGISPTVIPTIKPTLVITTSPTPTIRPTFTPTIRATVTPTLTTTVSQAITATPTPPRASTPTIGEVAFTPTPTPAIPVSGISFPTLGLTGVGLVLMGIGVLLVL